MLLGAGVLVACGGGGGGGDGKPVGSTAGVLTDAPVGGLNYSASSGPDDTTVITGVTTRDGRFTFDEGDTVTFSIGGIVIAEIRGQETITPREIAGAIVQKIESSGEKPPTLEDVVSNVFVFFQSLDGDNDPNTISIPEQIEDVNFAGVPDVDLTRPEVFFAVSPEQFQEDMTAVVEKIVETNEELAAVVEVVNPEEALQHATEQAQLLLAGTWRLRSTRSDGDPIDLSLTFFPNQTYLKGGLEGDENCGGEDDGDGVEFNTFDWDPLTGGFSTGTPAIDTDGDCGLGNIEAGSNALQVNGDELKFFDLDSSQQQCDSDAGSFEPYIDGGDACVFRFTRAVNQPRGIVGSFAFFGDLSDPSAKPEVFTIESTGNNGYRYLQLDSGAPVDTEEPYSAGVEIGTFTLGSNGVLNNVTVELDTNGDSGLGNGEGPIDGSSVYALVVTSAGDVTVRQNFEGEGFEDEGTLRRLPLLPRFSSSQLAGLSFYADENDDGVAATEADLHVITFFADGSYVLGGQANDPNCDQDYVDEGIGGELDPDGNGVEWGTWTLDPTLGTLQLGLKAPLSETNGSCGLYNANSNSRFFLEEIGVDAQKNVTFVRIKENFDEGESFVLRPVPSAATGLTPVAANKLVGTWITDNPDNDPDFRPEIITFFPDSSVFAASTRFSQDPDESEAGIERLKWSLNAAGDEITFTYSLNTYSLCIDTIGNGNDCLDEGGAGDVETEAFALSADGRTATFGTGEDAFVLRKLSLP
jgi:hypothetical protein